MGEKRRREFAMGNLRLVVTQELPDVHTTKLSYENACLNCGAIIDAVTSVDHKEMPYPGAIAICMVCSHIMAYDTNIQFRELNDQEIIGVAGNPEILRLINSLGRAKATWEKQHGEGSWGATARARLAAIRAKQ